MLKVLRNRSLLSRFVVLVITPLSLVLFGVIIVDMIAYQRTLTSLLVNRDQQLAAVAVERVSETMQGYARMLGTAASAPDLRSASAPEQAAALAHAAMSAQMFTAGMAIVDSSGQVLAATPPDSPPVENTVANQDYFQQLKTRQQPTFSNVTRHAWDERSMVIVAVPILNEQQAFSGALLGAFYLDDSALEGSIQRMTLGRTGYVYVVDRQGHVLFHPDPQYLGALFADRPFVPEVLAGQSGGTLWYKPDTRESLVIGYAPVQATGWGLIVRESWDSVSAPVRIYSLTIVLVAILAVGIAAYFLWRGVRAVTVPVRWLAEQTSRLAAGASVEPIPQNHVAEINSLSRDFNHMAAQIAAYRAGLRSYVGAITHSQEEERRRLSRDLHDDTVQSLLAIVRRLELHQACETDPQRLQELADLRTMVDDTLLGVRHISRDLRPMALDDLGLIPALQALVHAARDGQGGVPDAEFNLAGKPCALTPDQELALYRIAQEALTNIRKHAHATGLRIDLSFEPEHVRLEVTDDGQGFTVPDSVISLAQGNHFGLMGMQERAWSVGATMTVDSQPGRGTHLQVTMPSQVRTPALYG